jgi:dihydrofolate synthase / folylpolyglutamate synthase
VAVVTSIALDHTDWLGQLIEKVLVAKRPVFSVVVNLRLWVNLICRRLSQQVGGTLGAKLYRRGADWTFSVTDRWQWQGR